MSNERIEDLVARFIEQREAGEPVSPETFAREHPTDSHALLSALQRAEQAEQMLAAPDLPTDRLGPYRLLSLIGSGAMGRVYSAVHDDCPEQELALKILSPLALSDEKARARFDREARALAQLDHPGIVSVIDHGVVDGTPYLAMEWVRGSSLAVLLDQARSRRAQGVGETPRNWLVSDEAGDGYRFAAALMARLARAVAAVHATGMLHRDIKPANVLLTEDGAPVLGDFGLARGEETVSLTGSGDLLGTPRYMAPEQARGEATDERTDIHGLGVLLYELLTLQPPHQGSDPVSVLRAVAERRIPALKRSDPSSPEPLRRIIGRACAFRPAARYASAAELAEDLESFLRGSAVAASSMSTWERLADAWVLQRGALVASVLGALLLALIPFLIGDQPDLTQLVDRASLAYAAGDMAGTAAGAERILALAPDDPRGLFLERIAEGGLPPDSTDPSINALVLGMSHRAAQVWPEAIAAMQHARDLDPASPLPKVLLELVRSEMEQQTATRKFKAPPSTSGGDGGGRFNGQSAAGVAGLCAGCPALSASLTGSGPALHANSRVMRTSAEGRNLLMGFA